MGSGLGWRMCCLLVVKLVSRVEKHQEKETLFLSGTYLGRSRAQNTSFCPETSEYPVNSLLIKRASP